MVDYCMEYHKHKDKHGDDQTVQGQALKLLCAVQEGKDVGEIRTMVKDSCGKMNAWLSIQIVKTPLPLRELPKVQIGGKLYFRDDRLEEFRRVDRPGDRPIKFEELGAYATGKEVRAIFRPQRSAVK